MCLCWTLEALSRTRRTQYFGTTQLPCKLGLWGGVGFGLYGLGLERAEEVCLHTGLLFCKLTEVSGGVLVRGCVFLLLLCVGRWHHMALVTMTTVVPFCT